MLFFSVFGCKLMFFTPFVVFCWYFPFYTSLYCFYFFCAILCCFCCFLLSFTQNKGWRRFQWNLQHFKQFEVVLLVYFAPTRMFGIEYHFCITFLVLIYIKSFFVIFKNVIRNQKSQKTMILIVLLNKCGYYQYK